MFVTGFFGNLSVCCVIMRIPGMRSATNYYLFSLAVADLLILLVGTNQRTKVRTKRNEWTDGRPRSHKINGAAVEPLLGTDTGSYHVITNKLFDAAETLFIYTG